MDTHTHAHTQGPWCIHRGYANAQTMTVTEDDGGSWDFTHTYIAQGEKIIAQVQQQSKSKGWPSVQSVEEMWANARLIAAAPELLDACKAALAMFKKQFPLEHGNPELGAAWGMLEDAIIKVEGRDS